MTEEMGKLARSCDAVIRAASESMLRASLRIGWYGMILRKNNLFGELGFATEQDYFRSCNIGRSTWYRVIAIAERLEHLGRESVLNMKVENARILARCPDFMREDEDLAVMAATQTVKEFSRAVRHTGGPLRLGAINSRSTCLTIEGDGQQVREARKLLLQLGGVSLETLIWALKIARDAKENAA